MYFLLAIGLSQLSLDDSQKGKLYCVHYDEGHLWDACKRYLLMIVIQKQVQQSLTFYAIAGLPPSWKILEIVGSPWNPWILKKIL